MGVIWHTQGILRKHGYPPDEQQKAIDTILKQSELLADSVVRV
jgi:hypothetical protein